MNHAITPWIQWCMLSSISEGAVRLAAVATQYITPQYYCSKNTTLFCLHKCIIPSFGFPLIEKAGKINIPRSNTISLLPQIESLLYRCWWGDALRSCHKACTLLDPQFFDLSPCFSKHAGNMSGGAHRPAESRPTSTGLWNVKGASHRHDDAPFSLIFH